MNDRDVESTTCRAKNDRDMKINAGISGKAINKTDMKLNMGTLDEANTIMEKEVKL